LDPSVPFYRAFSLSNILARHLIYLVGKLIVIVVLGIFEDRKICLKDTTARKRNTVESKHEAISRVLKHSLYIFDVRDKPRQD
jgi:hypothetical protein